MFYFRGHKKSYVTADVKLVIAFSGVAILPVPINCSSQLGIKALFAQLTRRDKVGEN